ncbi:MAG: hypothetical protein JSW28_09185 [Thermoplasmata archaeon]|nr:MAG: hypothetical protein JSW28_09185 [Thermoplasmata archaeon]
MEPQQPIGEENRPPGGPAPQYGPPPADYSSPYGRPTTDELIKQSYPKRGSSYEKYFQPDRIVMMATLGVFLLFLGTILIAAVTTSGGPNEYDAKYDENDDGRIDSENYDKYIQDKRSYDAIRDIGSIAGKIIAAFGMLILVLALFGGGILNKDFDKFVRMGMIVAAGLIVAWSGLMI